MKKPSIEYTQLLSSIKEKDYSSNKQQENTNTLKGLSDKPEKDINSILGIEVST